jgi:hypothetical protein
MKNRKGMLDKKWQFYVNKSFSFENTKRKKKRKQRIEREKWGGGRGRKALPHLLSLDKNVPIIKYINLVLDLNGATSIIFSSIKCFIIISFACRQLYDHENIRR